MKLEHTRATFTAIWVLVMLAVTYGVNTTSASDWTTLAAVAIIPPTAMWLLWNDPPQSLSEGIQKARR